MLPAEILVDEGSLAPGCAHVSWKHQSKRSVVTITLSRRTDPRSSGIGPTAGWLEDAP